MKQYVLALLLFAAMPSAYASKAASSNNAVIVISNDIPSSKQADVHIIMGGVLLGKPAIGGNQNYQVVSPENVSLVNGGKSSLVKPNFRPYYSFDLKGVHFVVLDSTITGQSKGHIDSAQLSWFEKDVKDQRNDQPIVLLMFHSADIDSVGSRDIDNLPYLFPILAQKHFMAMVTSSGSEDIHYLNGVPVTAVPMPGGSVTLEISELLLTIDHEGGSVANLPGHLLTAPFKRRYRPSVLRSGWDDPDVPFLSRRRPA